MKDVPVSQQPKMAAEVPVKIECGMCGKLVLLAETVPGLVIKSIYGYAEFTQVCKHCAKTKKAR